MHYVIRKENRKHVTSEQPVWVVYYVRPFDNFAESTEWLELMKLYSLRDAASWLTSYAEKLGL